MRSRVCVPARTASAGSAALTGQALAPRTIVDCSEYPSIVFGRLEGDDEDIEDVERSSALAAYQDDVLTLLLWATSAERTASDRNNARETALSRSATTPPTTELSTATRLDRRIRARVIEVWNTDRPGTGTTPMLGRARPGSE